MKLNADSKRVSYEFLGLRIAEFTLAYYAFMHKSTKSKLLIQVTLKRREINY